MKEKPIKKAYLCTTKEHGWYEENPYEDYKEIICAENAEQAKRKYFKGEASYIEPDLKYIDVRVRRAKEYDKYEFEGREKNLYQIREILANRKWKEDMENLVKNNPGQKVYIYSGEWNSYWRANACGYTNSPNEVGVYEIEEAWNCVSHVDISKKISFEFVKNK